MTTIINIIKEQGLYNYDKVMYISKGNVLRQIIDMLNLNSLHESIMMYEKNKDFNNENCVSKERESEVQRLQLYHCFKSIDAQEEGLFPLIEDIRKNKIHARELPISMFIDEYKDKHKMTEGNPNDRKSINN